MILNGMPKFGKTASDRFMTPGRIGRYGFIALLWFLVILMLMGV